MNVIIRLFNGRSCLLNPFLLILILLPGISLSQNSNVDSLKRALESSTDDKQRVSILENLSYSYVYSYPDTAMQYALNGLELSKNTGYGKGEAICTNAIGNVYFQTGDYPKALEYYLSYLKMKEELRDKNNLSVAYFNVAGAFTESKDYRQALFYLQKAIQFDRQANDSAALLYDFYSLGSNYLRMGKNDSALFFLDKSYELVRILDDRDMIGAVLNTYGEVYLSRENYAEAEKNYRESIPPSLDINDFSVLNANYYGLAKIFDAEGKTDSAIKYAILAFEIASDAPFNNQAFESSNLLGRLFSKKNQFDSAFRYQGLSLAYKDSTISEDKLKKIQDLKLGEIQRQQALEREKMKYADSIRLYALLSLSAILLSIAFFLWRNNRQKKKANNLLQEQKEKVESTLAELRSTQTQLLQSEKMASLGQVTAGIAHEIQNPLNFVNNFSEVNTELSAEMQHALENGNIRDALDLAKDIEANQKKIREHGKRADSIVKAMIQHSAFRTSQKEPTDLNELCEEYLRFGYFAFKARNANVDIKLKESYDDSIREVDIDPLEFGKLIINLLNNAFYAVKEKLKSSPDAFVPTVSLSTEKKENRIEIRISDNGTGIPDSISDKIFQPFFTTKPTGQGTGLGLSLSYDIVKAHRGEIMLNSTMGEGSEFMVELPAT